MIMNIILGVCTFMYVLFCYVIVYAVAESMKKRDMEKYGYVFMDTDTTITIYYGLAVVMAPILVFMGIVMYFGDKLLKKVG